MAEKKRSSKSSKSSGKASSSGSRASSAAKKANQQKRPIRREVGAFVCLFLAVLTLLGLFGVDAVFIRVIRDLARGLVGAGLYVLPVALLLDFAILLFHDGRPVRLRVICSGIAVLCVGILAHLLGDTVHINWEFAMVGELWFSGIERASGGLAAGLLAMFLELIISKIGAVLLSIVLLILSAMLSCNITVVSLYKAIKNRPRVEYDPPKREHVDPAERIVNHVAQKQIERVERKRSAIADFDLPVDEPPALAQDEQPKTAKRPPKRSGICSWKACRKRKLPQRRQSLWSSLNRSPLPSRSPSLKLSRSRSCFLFRNPSLNR